MFWDNCFNHRIKALNGIPASECLQLESMTAEKTWRRWYIRSLIIEAIKSGMTWLKEETGWVLHSKVGHVYNLIREREYSY